MNNESVITNYNLLDDNVMDNTIRPESIEEYVGQTDVKENMNIFEKIIFIADYIEEERTHSQCKEAREYFYSSIDKTDNKMEILDKTIIISLKNTLSFLESKGLSINPMTNKAYLYLLAEYALQ